MVELVLTDFQAAMLEEFMYLLVDDTRLSCRQQGLCLYLIQQLDKQLPSCYKSDTSLT